MAILPNGEQTAPLLAQEGRALRDSLEWFGRVAQLGGQTFATAARGRIDVRALFEQVDVIGLASLTVATLTAISSGLVMAVQIGVQMDRFGAKEWVSSIVSISIVRELGPVLTALIVGGRVGAGIAAELGSMSVTEQIDAMRSMGANPVEKLVVPRVLAAILVMPLLTAFADVLGVIGVVLVTRLSSGINVTYSLNSVLQSVKFNDLTGGLFKTLFFGMLVGLIACDQGMQTTGGTQGVGRATTRTVVVGSITILITDFILTDILVGFGL